MNNNFVLSEVHALEKQMHISANKNEFGTWYSQMCWANEEYLNILSTRRREILAQLQKHGAQFGYNATKMDTRNLSPGCKLCAQGEWSCLFINNKCNASCFYCPSSQNDLSEPSTQSFVFQEPISFIAYLERFGFKGASLSGGEPFLTFDKTLKFAKAIKNHFGSNLHLWLYTNGILADEHKLNLLAEAGLDEIRFDIGATGYNTQKVALAVGRIPTVTVEIPAVDLEKLKCVCKELAHLGVNHLNLHQLRATPYNVERIIKKDFHFIHGPKVLVAESEIIALECIKYVLDNEISLPVNYCSFVFKNSHQTKAARLRANEEFLKPHEELTRAGFIRCLYVKAEPEILSALFTELNEMDSLPKGTVFNYQESSSQLFFNMPLLSILFTKGHDIFLSYSFVHLRGALSYQNQFKEILLGGKKVFVEKVAVFRNHRIDKILHNLLEKVKIISEEQNFLDAIMQTSMETNIKDSDYIAMLLRIKEFEYMKQGLQEYY